MSSAETVEVAAAPQLKGGRLAAATRNNAWLVQVIMIVSGITLWEILGRGDFLYGLIPPFTDTLVDMWVLLSSGVVWPHALTSAYEIGVGLSVAVLGGIFLGLGLGSVDYLRRVFEPLITYLAAIPKIILFPALLLFFGVGLESKMAMGALSGFVPVILNVLVGMREVDGKYIKMARSLGVKRLQMYQKIYLPGMVYPILAGVRLGTAVAIVGTLLGELKVSNGGMGWLADYYLDQFAISRMYAVLALIFIGAASINLLMTMVLSRLTRFKASEVAEGRLLM
jgi:ABC-type nitrate/sulfonate/bicarbonate transport system permease component